MNQENNSSFNHDLSFFKNYLAETFADTELLKVDSFYISRSISLSAHELKEIYQQNLSRNLNEREILRDSLIKLIINKSKNLSVCENTCDPEVTSKNLTYVALENRKQNNLLQVFNILNFSEKEFTLIAQECSYNESHKFFTGRCSACKEGVNILQSGRSLLTLGELLCDECSNQEWALLTEQGEYRLEAYFEEEAAEDISVASSEKNVSVYAQFLKDVFALHQHNENDSFFLSGWIKMNALELEEACQKSPEKTVRDCFIELLVEKINNYSFGAGMHYELYEERKQETLSDIFQALDFTNQELILIKRHCDYTENAGNYLAYCNCGASINALQSAENLNNCGRELCGSCR